MTTTHLHIITCENTEHTDLANNSCLKASCAPESLISSPFVLDLFNEIFCITVASTYGGRKGRNIYLVG